VIKGERVQPQNELPLQDKADMISQLWEKLDTVRWKRLKANI
jgi:hypothetical protein